MQGNRTFLGQLLFRVRRITGSESLRNSIFPGEEIGPNRVSSDKVQSGSPLVPRDSEKNKLFQESSLPRYSFAHVFRRIACTSAYKYIYMYVALLEKESILDVNDVEAKKRKEKGRKAKRNGGDRAPARCIVTFRSGHQPDQIYSDCIINGRSVRISYANRCRE